MKYVIYNSKCKHSGHAGAQNRWHTERQAVHEWTLEYLNSNVEQIGTYHGLVRGKRIRLGICARSTKSHWFRKYKFNMPHLYHMVLIVYSNKRHFGNFKQIWILKVEVFKGRQDVSVGKCACHQVWWPQFNSQCPHVKGESWLLPVVHWPPHMCCGLPVNIHSYLQTQ